MGYDIVCKEIEGTKDCPVNTKTATHSYSDMANDWELVSTFDRKLNEAIQQAKTAKVGTVKTIELYICRYEGEKENLQIVKHIEINIGVPMKLLKE